MNTPEALREANSGSTELQSRFSSIFDGDYEIFAQPREQLKSKLRILEADARFERRKNGVSFAVTLAAILGVIIVCLAILLSPSASATSQTWAVNILTSLTAFFFGRASNSRGS